MNCLIALSPSYFTAKQKNCLANLLYGFTRDTLKPGLIRINLNKTVKVHFIVVRGRSGHSAIGVKLATHLSGRSWHPDQEFLESPSFAMFKVKGRPMKALIEAKGVRAFPRSGFRPSSHPKERIEMDNSVKTRLLPNQWVSQLEGKAKGNQNVEKVNRGRERIKRLTSRNR
ncbi:MAG: hypothetical protein F6J94_14040 [Moorea sp. SIO1F2]|nr:hypothetical protein [Moorena sp. SIO1F2]NET83006.1 hypothetical protein [Moorena sp. SIO1F2]